MKEASYLARPPGSADTAWRDRFSWIFATADIKEYGLRWRDEQSPSARTRCHDQLVNKRPEKPVREAEQGSKGLGARLASCHTIRKTSLVDWARTGTAAYNQNFTRHGGTGCNMVEDEAPPGDPT